MSDTPHVQGSDIQPDPVTQQALEFVPTVDLVAALAKRHESIVISALPKNSPSIMQGKFYIFGGYFSCLGLVSCAHDKLRAAQFKR